MENEEYKMTSRYGNVRAKKREGALRGHMDGEEREQRTALDTEPALIIMDVSANVRQ